MSWKPNEVATILMDRILAEEAWDLLPILADSLEESGCDWYDGLLIPLRTGDTRLHGPWLRRLVDGQITHSELTEALDGLTEIASHFADYDDLKWSEMTKGMSYREQNEVEVPRLPGPGPEFLIEACARRASDPESHNTYTHLGFDTPDIAYERLDDIWKYYRVLTGEEVREVPTQWDANEMRTPGLFRCAC